MQRLPELEHHVVGHVDHVADAPHAAALQPPPQPRRRRPDAHALEHPGGEARAAHRVGNLDADGVGAPTQRDSTGTRSVRRSGTPSTAAASRPTPEVAERVAAVRRDVHLEHHVLEPQRLRQRRPGDQVLREDEQAARVVGQPELLARAEHPVALHPAEAGPLDGRPAGQAPSPPWPAGPGPRPGSSSPRRRPGAARRPASTWVTVSFSAFGCGAAAAIRATTTPASASAGRCIPSTSRPARVRRRASSSAARQRGDEVGQPLGGDLHG